jgi:HEAT repeat protein
LTTDSSPQLSAQFEKWRAAVDAGRDARCEAFVAQLTPADLPHIIALYEDLNENRRWWAVRALADLGGPEQQTVLIRALQDPSSDIRATAAICAAQVIERFWSRDQAFAQALLDALAQRLMDDLGFVRQATADALAQLGECAIPYLWQVLECNDESARTRAAYALRKMQSAQAANYLYHLLEDRNPMVSLYAREGLDDMGLLDMAYFQP